MNSATPKYPTTGSVKLEYAYDYMNRRVRKVAYAWNGSAWNATPDSDIRFVYDQWNLLLELDGLHPDANGVLLVVKKHTWGLDLSGQNGNPSSSGLHGAGGIGGLLAFYDTNGTTGTTTGDKSAVYLYDANGNVGQLIDTKFGSPTFNQVAGRYDYDAYGNTLLADGPFAAANPIRFSTKYFIPETGHYDYGRRVSDPQWGRWTSRDPSSEKASLNLYSLVDNAPLDFVDPDGRQSTRPSDRAWPDGWPPPERPIDLRVPNNWYNCAGLAFRDYKFMTLEETEARLSKCERIPCTWKCHCGDLKCWFWRMDISIRLLGPVGLGEVDLDANGRKVQWADFHIVCGLIPGNDRRKYGNDPDVCSKTGRGPIERPKPGPAFEPKPPPPFSGSGVPTGRYVVWKNFSETCYCCNR